MGHYLVHTQERRKSGTLYEQMGHYLVHTTYPIFFVPVFAEQLCLPVPAVLFLLAGGAMAGSGQLSFTGIMLVSVLGSLLADCFW